jgi:hypothetical protein
MGQRSHTGLLLIAVDGRATPAYPWRPVSPDRWRAGRGVQVPPSVAYTASACRTVPASGTARTTASAGRGRRRPAQPGSLGRSSRPLTALGAVEIACPAEQRRLNAEYVVRDRQAFDGRLRDRVADQANQVLDLLGERRSGHDATAGLASRRARTAPLSRIEGPPSVPAPGCCEHAGGTSRSAAQTVR